MYTITGGPHVATKTAQSNQSTMMSKSISSPLSTFTSGSAFDVMDKTGCEHLIYTRSGFRWETGQRAHKNSKSCTRKNVLETHEIAVDFTDQSHMNTYRHYRPQWVLFLPDWTTAQTGKGGLYRSPPSGHNWGKTGYSWSKVTTKANAGKNNGGLQVRWSILLRQH